MITRRTLLIAGRVGTFSAAGPSLAQQQATI